MTFHDRHIAQKLRAEIPARQQAHWDRQLAEKKIRDALLREGLQGERRALQGYRSAGHCPAHLEARLREIEAQL